MLKMKPFIKALGLWEGEMERENLEVITETSEISKSEIKPPKKRDKKSKSSEHSLDSMKKFFDDMSGTGPFF